MNFGKRYCHTCQEYRFMHDYKCPVCAEESRRELLKTLTDPLKELTIEERLDNIEEKLYELLTETYNFNNQNF